MAMIFQQKGRKKYQVRFCINGDRKTLVLSENQILSSHIANTIESIIMYNEANLPLPPDIQKAIPSFNSYIIKKLGEWGVIEKESTQTLLELIAEYKVYLLGKRRTADHIKKTIRYISQCMEFLCYVYPKDIRSEGIHSFLRNLLDRELSYRTHNGYLQAIKQFNQWMNIYKGIAIVELRHISKLNPKNDRRDISRVLSDDECITLLLSLKGIHHGLISSERKLVYLFGLEAGLRWGEITKLKVSDIDLNSRKVIIRPEIEKARRGGEIPLSNNLFLSIKEYLLNPIRLPNCKLFENIWMDKGAEMLRKDLESANIPYTTREGNANFHALRHTFCTNLAKSGATPQLAQRLMRHSTVNLTTNYYTHYDLEDMRVGINQLEKYQINKSG